ncbi:glycosyl transferase family 2 [Thalassoporum mexicanum PCC 7367]|uniref:glycosyltransferase family 2 protein n=1 Tax=Thalassoporum mexicanum TaxID=3457544 RepID=UPI00029FBEAB|nr:glycosyltransferase [Pseudanabaena sp. PCC 7367]AFY69752.1 glycosyl transferase family 2 [Pseudanabaena sp. PCC 7367]
MSAEPDSTICAANPLVSIVSVYYNRQGFITESINSLLEQTYQNLEIIVIDDGSTDDTYTKLKAIQDSRLTVISHANMGFTRSIKQAVALTKGEYVAVHGSGDISLPTRIEKQVALLQQRPDVGVVGCYVETINEWAGYSLPYERKLEGNITKAAQQINPFTHGEVMFRRSVYESVGGYREFFRYAQDYDLWLRISLQANFEIVTESLYKRFIFPTSVSASIDKVVVQKCLSSFAVQCIDQRIEHGADLIDRYGEYAAFFRTRDRKLAKELWKLAIKLIYVGDFSKAGQVNRLSINEVNLGINFITQGVIYLLQNYQLMRQAIALIFMLLGKVPALKMNRMGVFAKQQQENNHAT